MKILLAITFLFTVVFVQSQPFQVQGIVTNEKDNTPLAGASVFINNGSQGTTTDAEGRFTLTGIPYNSFELIISFVSFETIVVNISPENIGKRFRIKMSPKENELEEVIVGAVEKDGWKKYGKIFLDNFLGTSVNARKCDLVNPQTLKFRFNKKTGILSVSATDQLRIKNHGLGYDIKYQLEQFEYNQSKGMVIYLGYINFEDMGGAGRRRNVRWEKERQIAFDGSMMHFMRAFYRNNLVAEGFNIRQLIRLNSNDSAVRPIYRRIMQKDYSDIDTAKFSVQFVHNGLNQTIYILGRQPLAADSIRYTDSVNNSMLMHSTTEVQVVYSKERESREFLNAYLRKDAGGPQTSRFYFRTNRPILVQENGLFFQPLDIFAEGYWAFEKLAEALPTDYVR